MKTIVLGGFEEFEGFVIGAQGGRARGAGRDAPAAGLTFPRQEVFFLLLPKGIPFVARRHLALLSLSAHKEINQRKALRPAIRSYARTQKSDSLWNLLARRSERGKRDVAQTILARLMPPSDFYVLAGSLRQGGDRMEASLILRRDDHP